MSEKVISVPSMHDDHRNWQSQHSMWQDDVMAWQKELATAQQDAHELLKTLEHQAKVLSDHKNKIEKEESALKTHEHEIASNEHFGTEVPESLTTKHLQMVKQAEAFASEHEGMKKHHHALVAKMNEIHKLAASS